MAIVVPSFGEPHYVEDYHNLIDGDFEITRYPKGWVVMIPDGTGYNEKLTTLAARSAFGPVEQVFGTGIFVGNYE